MGINRRGKKSPLFGKHSWNYKGVENYCKCGKKLSFYAKRCKSCENKRRIKLGIISKKGRSLSEEHKNKIRISTKKAYTNKNLRDLRKKIAIDLWKNLEYRNKVVKNTLKGLSFKPNKPEKILIHLLKQTNFKYVGNGKCIIHGFNPDFVDIKDKKIIEMFGDYWHNKKDYKKRDRRKLKIYSKLGYKTLIIWEHELKNINKIIKKLERFIK